MAEHVPDNGRESEPPALPVAAQFALGVLLGVFGATLSVLLTLLGVALGIWYWAGVFLVLWLVTFVTLKLKWPYFAVGIGVAVVGMKLALIALGGPLW